jgi:hypothetical protein
VEVLEIKSSIIYTNPTWVDGGFVEDAPQKLWLRSPEAFQKIALEELKYGNEIDSIIENRERNIVLLSFEKGPLVQRQDKSFRIHSKHAYGNYCYDGTNSTYEDIESGCFLAFKDPDYKHPSSE